jgi:hypothetical protein
MKYCSVQEYMNYMARFVKLKISYLSNYCIINNIELKRKFSSYFETSIDVKNRITAYGSSSIAHDTA